MRYPEKKHIYYIDSNVINSKYVSAENIKISGNNVLTGNNNLYAYSNQVVYLTGNQTISGLKNFSLNPDGTKGIKINNSGVLLENEAIWAQSYTQPNLGAIIPPAFYQINGPEFLVGFSYSTDTRNVVLPQSPKNNTTCEITIGTNNPAEFAINIFTTSGAIASNQKIATVVGGQGKAGYTKLTYFNGFWYATPLQSHASTHRTLGSDPINPTDINAVSQFSNYYTNNLQAKVSVIAGEPQIYGTTSQVNGKSYWQAPYNDSNKMFEIKWNTTNNSWELGIIGSTIFVRSYHNVPEPYMATGWQSVNYGATLQSFYRLPNIDITNQQIKGNLLIDNVYANNLIYNTGDQIISGNKTFINSGIFVSGIDLQNSKLVNAVPEIINFNSNFNIIPVHNNRIVLGNSSTIITGYILSGNATGFNASIIQAGVGQVQITGSGIGVIINSYNNQYKTAGQFASISLLHTGNNGYIMYGNTAL